MKASTILVLIFLCLAPLGALQAQDSCDRKLLVSSYRTNDVKVFDGCSGEFLQSVTGGGLNGTQAIRRGPDGLLYVVSEGNNRVIRFDPETLEYVDVFVSDDSGALQGPTGLDFGSDGDLYVGGFGSSNVVRYDGESGAMKGVFIPTASNGIAGIDAGLAFGPDGNLYVPGYNSNSVLRFSPSGQALSPLATGISQPRVIVFDEARDRILVSAYGEGKIRRFRLSDGTGRGSLTEEAARSTGMAFDVDGTLLITSDLGNAVARLDPQTGDRIGLVVERGAGGLDGATFIYVLETGQSQPPAEPRPQEADDLYWLSGVGTVEGTRIVVEEVSETSGTAFGADFEPQDVSFRRWGSLEIEFTGCTEADFAWTSEGEDALGFGNGSYAIQPLADGINIQRCQSEGFATAITKDLSWASGGWFGGEARSGEGLMLDVIGEQAFVTWFTYRPATSP